MGACKVFNAVKKHIQRPSTSRLYNYWNAFRHRVFWAATITAAVPMRGALLRTLGEPGEVCKYYDSGSPYGFFKWGWDKYS